jgi:hypothetical protein
MVDQLRASWNPLMAWLRDVQAWACGNNMVRYTHDNDH